MSVQAYARKEPPRFRPSFPLVRGLAGFEEFPGNRCDRRHEPSYVSVVSAQAARVGVACQELCATIGPLAVVGERSFVDSVTVAEIGTGAGSTRAPLSGLAASISAPAGARPRSRRWRPALLIATTLPEPPTHIAALLRGLPPLHRRPQPAPGPRRRRSVEHRAGGRKHGRSSIRRPSRFIVCPR
jgi:hypothetical protein